MRSVRSGDSTQEVGRPIEQPQIEEHHESTQQIGQSDPASLQTVTGPNQETVRTRSMKVDAAVDAAKVELRRLGRVLNERFDATSRSQAEALRTAVLRSAEALTNAIALPEVRHDPKAQQKLAVALGTILDRLEDAMAAIAEQGITSRKMHQLSVGLEAAYDKLIAPATTLRSDAGEFIAIPEAIDAAKAAYAKFEQALARLTVKGRKLSHEAESALFRAILANDRLGSLMSIDAGIFDFLPEHLARAITRDHHGMHADPGGAEINSTIRFLEDVERVCALPISGEEKLQRLEHQFRVCVTNNLGDAILPLVLIQRLPELVAHGGIQLSMKKGTSALVTIDHLKRLSHFEDFGFFGSENMLEGKKRSGPKDVVLRDLIHVVLANYQVFDELLAKYGIRGSDRFDGLPPEKQTALVAEARAMVEQNLDHYEMRLDRAEKFKDSVEELKDGVMASHASMRASLLEQGVSKEDLDTLEGKVFYFSAQTKGGRFATWDAPSLVHKNQIQWESIDFGNGKFGFVLAVPSGRNPSFLDTTMVKAFGPSFPKGIPRGDTLFFVFNPADGDVPPAQMAKALAEQLRKHAVQTPAAPEIKLQQYRAPGDNVISHDAYMYDDRGDYSWTKERHAEAQRLANEAFDQALRDPKFGHRVVLLMGLPGAGKTTWLRTNQDPRAIFVDETLTTPEKRKALIEKAKQAGKIVEVVWVDTPFELCCERSATRPDRDIPQGWMDARRDELANQPPHAREGMDILLVVRP